MSFAAANNGDILPLTVFAVLFALALDPDRRPMAAALSSISSTPIARSAAGGYRLGACVAPLGVFALAFTVGAAAGGAAFAGLGHYVVIISADRHPGHARGLSAGRMSPADVGLGAVHARADRAASGRHLDPLVACVASRHARRRRAAMGIREEVSDVTLPIAVALFRATGPAMNTAVAFYVAHWLGLQPTLAQMIAATAVGAVMSYGAVSLPGEVSYISSIAPIALALGVPIAPLGLLVAVEMVPDIFRTVGNVTHDVALASIVDRGSDPQS